MSRLQAVYCRYYPTAPVCRTIVTTTARTTTSSVRTTTSVASSTSRTTTTSTSRPSTSSTTSRPSTSSTTSRSSTSSTTSRSSTSSTTSRSSTSSTTSRSSTSSTTSRSSSSTSSSSSSSSSSSTSASASAIPSGNSKADILVIARDQVAANNIASGFNGYGIPYSTLVVPQAGTTLPALNTTDVGNYGGIVIQGQVSYDYGATGFQSALTADQWNQLYAYQTSFGARMVHLDVYPGALFGTVAIGGCCGALTDDQPFTFTNTAGFAQAGFKLNVPISTKGLYHYGATISDPATTTEIGSWVANSVLAKSTGAVINNFAGRQQMAFFIGWAPEFSSASNIMQHAYITWITRGLYAGFRRVNFNTQIDDVFLQTDIYKNTLTTPFRTRVGDMTAHAAWVSTVQAKMSPGSFYVPEMGHNGNGNIEASTNSGEINMDICAPGPIYYDEIIDTPLEFQKPLGTGKNFWPTTPTVYGFSTACLDKDALKTWMQLPANRDKFAHMSHTFTHMELNNATYSDAIKEIQFNQAWLQATGLSAATLFSPKGLIPPAITGTHNGDVLRAWTTAGLTNCVGDNTRVPLRNANNPMWPYFTTVAANGFDGFQINPRWATRIYYNCDSADCTASEWVATSTPVPSPGTFDHLMETEVSDNLRHFFGLYREGYMFHQANLRQTDVPTINVNGTPQKLSIFQAWVETMVFQFTSLVNWPMITLKHDDMSASFLARFQRDACKYKLAYLQTNGTITGVQVSSETNNCASPIPITFPTANKPTTLPAGATSEQIGNDPYTVWLKLTGAPVTIPLGTPLSW